MSTTEELWNERTRLMKYLNKLGKNNMLKTTEYREKMKELNSINKQLNELLKE